MGEGKHTPGPWLIGVSADHTPLVMVPAHEREGSGFGIACVNRLPRMGSVSGNMEANARLIAAAPDLLAALVACVESLRFVAQEITGSEAGEFEAWSHPANSIRMAEAAIAAATPPTTA